MRRGYRFWLNGSRHYRNADQIVHRYDYLLSGARRARCAVVAPRLVSAEAVVDAGRVGPFRLEVSDMTALRVAGGHAVVDADETAVGNVVEAGRHISLCA